VEVTGDFGKDRKCGHSIYCSLVVGFPFPTVSVHGQNGKGVSGARDLLRRDVRK
jgi:hypothetical protein